MTDAELKTKSIGVLMGGLSAEREVSLQSGTMVAQALTRRGYRIECLDVDHHLPQRLLQAGVEVAFIALHGRYGEDGCIQGLLEAMAIPYTGSGVLASALAMDKVQAKRLFTAMGIPTAPWHYPLSATADEEVVQEIGLPVVIKPRKEGSSVGLTIVHALGDIPAAIARAGGVEEALIERYIRGHELTAAVLGRGEEARCLGVMEIRPKDGLYDYEAKYNREDTQYLVPAPIPQTATDRCQELALRVHRLLGCAGATRTDFIWDESAEPLVLELNTIPGMTSHSLLPMLARYAGMSYEDLVEAMLRDASLKG
jgi:D-alanine-D-alanine ligase